MMPLRRTLSAVARRGAPRVPVRHAGSAALPPFHLAVPVHDLDAARAFYGGVLGCEEGRRAETWQDFSLSGHQLVVHRVEGYEARRHLNDVDGDAVPVPHFGLVLPVDEFHRVCERVREAGREFELEPHLRHRGLPGEQWTCFFRDASGNAVELKAMTDPAALFAKH